jgi:tRNA threonylcarbamoyladenosine biosynthesis protein TsaB
MKKESLNPVLLYIETATEVCSVAVAEGEMLLSVEEQRSGNAHAQQLMPLINEALKKAEIGKKRLQGVVLSIGPGSYTGLRIGTSTAKGICYALDIPLITVLTLQSIVMGASNEKIFSKPHFFAPMIDARRMEVYTALFNAQGEAITEVKAVIVDETTYRDLLQTEQVVFCGNGAAKCRPLYADCPNACFSEALLSAKNMILPALTRYQQGQFEDVAYLEPFYLKEFIAAPAHIKGLY